MHRLVYVALFAVACDNNAAVTVGRATVDAAGPAPVDLGAPVDLAMTIAPDLAAGRDLGHAESPPDLSAADDLAVILDLGHPADLSQVVDLAKVTSPDFGPPSGDDSPLGHAPPSSLSGANTWFGGEDILDVSTDQGGGVWAVTSGRVHYRAPSGAIYNYDQGSGLARGWATWTDTWFGFGTAPVTFAAVAGGLSGEAVIGNVGAIADRLQVNPANGAVQRIDNMKVVIDSSDPTIHQEQVEQSRRVVAATRAVVDLNGVFAGTSYLGGFHGMYAFHGLQGDCQCQEFQQHNHAFANWAEGGIGGGDVKALAISPDGDVWQGDRDLVALWPQRSLGPRVDFFQETSAVVDVFPNVRDEVWGVGVDSSNGVYVASYGNGLAYLSPVTHQPINYWSRATTLPQNHLTDVTVDGAGKVWVATQYGGVARFDPASQTWSYYTTGSGLASNQVHRIYFDKYGGGMVYFATANGLTRFHP